MLNVITNNQIHLDADKLFNNWVSYNRNAERKLGEAFQAIVKDGSMVEYVENRLNDSEAFTGKSKDEIKQVKQNWTRRCKRAVATYYYKTDDSEAGGHYTNGLEVKYNRTDRIYTAIIRPLASNETIASYGDIIEKKEKEKKEENGSTERPDNASKVKDLQKDNEGLTNSLNANSKELAQKEKEIKALKEALANRDKEIERLKKDHSVLVNEIHKKGVRITALREAFPKAV